MFLGRHTRSSAPYTTPGKPNEKVHVGRHQVLDDGAVYAYCSCGWTATGRGEIGYDTLQWLGSHTVNG